MPFDSRDSELAEGLFLSELTFVKWRALQDSNLRPPGS
jgi:hypothetical protein